MNESKSSRKQRLSRAAACSLPSALALFRRLGSRSLIVESQMSSILNRLKPADLLSLFGEDVVKVNEIDADSSFFAPDRFARCLHCTIANLLGEVWSDDQFTFAPAFVVYPIVTLINEIIVSLEESTKSKEESQESSRASLGSRLTSSNEGNRDISEVHERLSRSIYSQ